MSLSDVASPRATDPKTRGLAADATVAGGAEMQVIGRPWTLHLGIRGDGVPTVRHTTFVRRVVADPSN